MLNKLPIIPFAELLAKGFSFIIVILLTRLLSIEEYGVFNYIVSLVLLMSVVMDGGINNFIFNKSLKNDLDSIGIYFSGRLFLSSVIVILFWIILYILEVQYLLEIIFYTTFVFFNSSLSFFKMLARGRELKKIDIENILYDPFFRLTGLLFLFLIGTNSSLKEIFILFSSIEILLFIYSYIKISKYISLHLKFSNIFEKTKNVLYESKDFLLYYFFFVLIQRIDVVLMSYFINEKSVALFSSAYNIYMVIILFFSSWITSSLYKILSTSNNFFKFLNFILLGYAVVSISVFFSIDFLYAYIYPSEYAIGSQILKCFLIGLPFMIISYLGMYTFNYMDKQKVNMNIFIIISIVKLLALLLIASNELFVYVYIMIIFEVFIGTTYIIIINKNRRLIFENITNK